MNKIAQNRFETMKIEVNQDSIQQVKLINEVANILIVDDNTFNVFSLKLVIEETFKQKCDQAFSAKEALNIIKERLAEGKGVHKLILTDINMPEIDGMQMSRMIKKSLERLQAGTPKGFINPITHTHRQIPTLSAEGGC